MIRVIVGLFFVTLVNWTDGQGILFEDERRHFKPTGINSSGFFDRRNRPLMNNPSSVDHLLQIPITVIQGSSVNAQSSSPHNKNAANKFINTPVQNIQSNLLKNKNLNQYYLNQANNPQERRDRLLEIRENELKRRQQIIEQKRLQQQQQRIDQKKLFDEKRKEKIKLQHKMQENNDNDDDDDDDDDHSLDKRQARFFNLHGWSSALTDVLWEELGLGHGHGYGNIFNNGGHGGIFDGHKKKKKKKKKPFIGNIWNNHGGHQGGHGSHLGGLGSHLGGHGSHGNYGLGSYGNYGQGSYGSHGLGSNGIYGGLQQFFSGLNNNYQVTENLDDVSPQRPIFGWQKPFKDEEKIENKIAPGFVDNSRSN